VPCTRSPGGPASSPTSGPGAGAVDGCVSGTSQRGEVVGHTAAGRSWLWSRGRLTAVPVPPGETVLRLQAVVVVGSSDGRAVLWMR
jgi:hypothetical protein